MQHSSTPGGSLNGWKDIANYLGISVRTAQNWEKNRALPVRRLLETPSKDAPPAKKSTKGQVFAFPAELEAWRKVRSAKVRKRRPQGHFSTRNILGGCALVSLLLVFTYRNKTSCDPARIEFQEGLFRAVSRTGGVCWTRPVPEGLALSTSREGVLNDQLAHMADLEGDGKEEILLIMSPDERSPSSSGYLYCLSEDGGVRWRFRYGGRFKFGERSFSDVYRGAFVTTLRAYDETLVLSAANHYPWFPSQVAVMDPKGTLIGEFWHPGYFESFAVGDINKDGVDEVFLGGINNPGPGIGHPAIVQLNTQLATPASVPPVHRLEAPNPALANYVLLPQPDVFVAERRGATVAALSLLSDRIRAKVALPGVPGLYYELDFNLGSLDVHASRFTSGTARPTLAAG